MIKFAQVYSWLKLVGIVVALLGVGGAGGSILFLERENDNQNSDISKLELSQYTEIMVEVTTLRREVSELKRTNHDKETACRVLEATISARKYSHSYCPEGKE